MAEKRVAGLGARIRKARKDADLSQDAVCAALGWRQSELSKIERGDRIVTAARVALLAPLLGVSADYLLGLPAPKRPKPSRRPSRKA